MSRLRSKCYLIVTGGGKSPAWKEYDDADYCNGEFFGSQQEALDHYYKLLAAKAEDVAFDTGKDCESEWQVTVYPVDNNGDYNFDEYEDRGHTRYYHHLPAADVELEKGISR